MRDSLSLGVYAGNRTIRTSCGVILHARKRLFREGRCADTFRYFCCFVKGAAISLFTKITISLYSFFSLSFSSCHQTKMEKYVFKIALENAGQYFFSFGDSPIVNTPKRYFRQEIVELLQEKAFKPIVK